MHAQKIFLLHFLKENYKTRFVDHDNSFCQGRQVVLSSRSPVKFIKELNYHSDVIRD